MEINISTDWKLVKKIFKQSLMSSLHFSITSIDENMLPHITPIGSLILGKPGQAIYFEEFTHKLKTNIEARQNICVMAVNSNKWFWFKSLFYGKFSEPPAIRLHGIAGKRRQATEAEIIIWQKRVRLLSFTKGHNLLWKQMTMVREITFTDIDPVTLGAMSRYK
jgi:hypothetical protein